MPSDFNRWANQVNAEYEPSRPSVPHRVGNAVVWILLGVLGVVYAAVLFVALWWASQ